MEKDHAEAIEDLRTLLEQMKRTSKRLWDERFEIEASCDQAIGMDIAIDMLEDFIKEKSNG